MNSKQRSEAAKALPSEFDANCLLAVRICLLAIALLTTTAYVVFFNVSKDNSIFLLYRPIALFFGFCAFSSLWLLWRRTTSNFLAIQFVADALFITAMLWLTGGGMSPLLFLYAPLAIGVAVLSGRKAALLLSLICIALYSFLIFAIEFSLIPNFSGQDFARAPKNGYLLQLIGLSSALFLVSVGAGYLRDIILRGLLLASASQQTLTTLEQTQRALVDGVSEGVVSTDQEGLVTHVNGAAQRILRCDSEAILGQKFKDFLRRYSAEIESADGSWQESIEPIELKLRYTESEELQIQLSLKEIINEHGEQSGTLFILRDVTELRSMKAQLQWQDELQGLSEDKSPLPGCYPDLPGFVGESQVMQKVFRLIERVASSEASVLITGESGTGKELVARALHMGSERNAEKFVAVNCGAIPENLIESQLFGHKKGSFTGAEADHIGFFQQAEGGTIFLDELGELPLQMQTKLLRVLQERVIRPVGGEMDIPVNVRILSATNKNLKREVASQAFREDLFYRLNVITISLPPLRERQEDIPLLVKAILAKLNKGVPVASVTPRTMQLLARYSYPGNVRELENILERALVLGGEIILPEHLPDALHTVEGQHNGNRASAETQIIIDESLELPIELDAFLERIERQYLVTALEHTDGAKKKAAEMLGMNFRSFRYRLKKFELSD